MSNAKGFVLRPHGPRPTELRHLRHSRGVAEALSFARAAARLNVTQPALSRQIRNDLERELGLQLFDRVGRQVRLTPQGEDLLGRSRDTLADVEALRDRARSLEGGRAGTLGAARRLSRRQPGRQSQRQDDDDDGVVPRITVAAAHRPVSSGNPRRTDAGSPPASTMTFRCPASLSAWYAATASSGVPA